MKKNPYVQYNHQMLKSFEAGFKKDINDPTLTLKEQSNARKNLALVYDAMRKR